MITLQQEIHGSGQYAMWTVMPEIQHIELRVTTSHQQVSLTTIAPKRIHVYAIYVSTTVFAALTSTLRASISFGTGGTTIASNILWSGQIYTIDSHHDSFISGIHAIGNIGEPVTLTNTTFAPGDNEIQAVIYYTEG